MLRRIAFSCCFFICCLSSVWSQHYVFIESDGQPFYVKKSGKVYSSSSSGFLIIPKVADSTVVLTLGFPRNQFPELSFSFALMDRDRGFQLKKMDDKGWLLFDRSSMETIEVGNQLVTTPAPVPQEKKGFADVLMQVTGDSSLVAKSPEQKGNEKSLGATVQIERAEVKVDVPVEIKQTIRVTNNNKEEVVDIEIDKLEKPYKPMPVKSEVENPNPIDEKVEPKVIEATKPVEKEKTVQSDNVKTRDDERQDRVSKVAVEEANKVQAVKSLRVCSAPFASDKDVKSLKKKMLGIVSDQAIVDAVVKAMGERCYSCRQLAEISWMFTDEQVRLKLFQRAYALVSDPEKFSDLESTLVQDAALEDFRKISSQYN